MFRKTARVMTSLCSKRDLPRETDKVAVDVYRTTQVQAGTAQHEAGTRIQLAGALHRRGPSPADGQLERRRVAGWRAGDAATAGRGEGRARRAGL